MVLGVAVKRKKWKQWLYLAATAIVLWLVFAIWVYNKPKYGYEPTGDELFDRLALLVLDQTPDFSNTLGRLYVLVPSIRPEFKVDYSQIKEWEAAYGDDPRYWQLRWYFADKITALMSPTPIVSQSTLDVISKIDEGIYDTGSYYAIDYYHLHSVDPERALALASRAIDSEQDNAYFYYLLAALLNKDGQTERALAKLIDGNMAPRYSSAGAYPLSVMVGHPELFTNDSNRAVGGEVYMPSVFDGMHSIAVKQIVKDQLKQGTGGVSPQTLDELMVFSQRFQKQEFRSIVNALISTVLVGEVLIHFKGSGSVLNPDQQAEFDQIEIAKKTLINEFKSLSQQSGSNWKKTGQYESPYKSNIRFYEGYAAEKEFLEKNQLLFDLLDPPPFSTWARGETVGILDKVKASAPPLPKTGT